MAVEMSQSVAMTHIEPFVVKDHCARCVVHFDRQFFLEIVEHPHVVVADEIVDFDALVGEGRQFAQKPHIAPWHHMSVTEPEVENVAQENQSASVEGDFVEQLAELFLAYSAIVVAT